jgi:ElaB/YqjD/DUF883 family membrane-anchored ribosome-binding protein
LFVRHDDCLYTHDLELESGETTHSVKNFPQPFVKKEGSIMQGNENDSLLEKATHIGERLVGLRGEVARLKTTASYAVEDAVTEAKRFARRGRYAAQDLMEDAAHRVKRDPLRAVAFGLVLGFSLGVMAVWLATREASE